MNCKNCKYWQNPTKNSFYNNQEIFKQCVNKNFIYDHRLDNSKLDALYFVDGEDYKADLVTGPNFGCVHFEVLS